MGVGSGLYMYVVVIQKFTFAISSPDEFLYSEAYTWFLLSFPRFTLIIWWCSNVSKETCRDSEITKCPASHQACYTRTHNRFAALFPGPPGWAGARRELLDSVVQGKINGGRHNDHLDGWHSIRTNQCPPPASHFMQAGCPSCHPTNCVKALKASMLLCQKPQLRLKY